MNTKSNELNKKVVPYILNAIDGSGYGRELNSDAERLAFLAETFKSEYLYPENLRYYGSIQNCMKNWIMGLPSSFNIDFENYRIIEIGKQWLSIPSHATEKQEDKLLENWFNFIAGKTLQLFKKHKINL